jgi:two-component system response regulator HupR/HoxA
MNRVLFVDDEQMILNSLMRGLRDEPYECYFASSGYEALKILQDHEISVLVTDMKMPGMSGLDLLKAVKFVYPDLVKLVLSGYTQLPQVLVTINQGDIFKFITKPWDLDEELKGIIQESVNYYNYKITQKKEREDLAKQNVSLQNILKKYDDKTHSIADEVVFMKSMNERMIKEIIHNIKRWDPKTESKIFLIEEVAIFEKLLLDGFELIPTQVKRFNVKSIIEDIKKNITDRQSVIRVETGIDSKMQTLVKGRYEVILFTLTKIIELLIVDEGGTHISLIFSGEETDEADFQLSMVISVKNKAIVKTLNALALAQWLSDWTIGFGGQLLISDKGENKIIVVKMPCEV